MKKLVTKSIKVLLILLILISALFACEQNVPDGNGNPPEDESGENQPSDDNTQAEAGIELTDEDSDLISALIEYLKQSIAQVDKASISAEMKIDQIKNGEAQPLLIDVDPNNYYFVCAYFEGCEHQRSEKSRYFCASKYTWIKYESADNIKEKYNSMDCIVAFQLNESSLCKNILTEDEHGNNFVHFTPFYPKFVDGTNVNHAKIVDKTFIYLNKSATNTVYYSSFIALNDWYTIRCVSLESQYYISGFFSRIDSTTEDKEVLALNEEFLVWYFGKYRDALTGIMDNKEYSKLFDGTEIYYYGLIEVDKFVNEIIKK